MAGALLYALAYLATVTGVLLAAGAFAAPKPLKDASASPATSRKPAAAGG